MKTNYTDISIVLDRSGSMNAVKDDTIGGYNKFLRDQQAAPGTATITLAQFDDHYEIVYNAAPIGEAKPLDDATFVPRGYTALFDAIGRTIDETGRRLAKLSDSERPDKVVFVIITDGHENASKEFSAAEVKKRITHQREAYKWEFVFLGANQDAITAAQGFGINTANAMTYAQSGGGITKAFGSLSSNVASYRAGTAMSTSFSVADRQSQLDELKKKASSN